MVGHAVTCWYMTCGSWISERLHPNYGWYIAMFPPHTVVYCRWWNMVNLANNHVWIIPAHVLIQSFTALTPLQPQIQRWSQGQHQSLASAQSPRLVLTGHTHVGWPWEWTGSVSKFQDPNVWESLRWIYIFSLSEAVQFQALALLFFRTPFPRVQKGLKNTARMSDIRYSHWPIPTHVGPAIGSELPHRKAMKARKKHWVDGIACWATRCSPEFGPNVHCLFGVLHRSSCSCLDSVENSQREKLHGILTGNSTEISPCLFPSAFGRPSSSASTGTPCSFLRSPSFIGAGRDPAGHFPTKLVGRPKN